MIKFQETGLVIKNVWSKIHRSNLLDQRLDLVKTFLKKKYFIDYLGVNLVNKEKTHYIANMGHDEWHTYTWDNHLVDLCPYFPKHLNLETGHNGIVFFDYAKEIRPFGGQIIYQNDLRAYYMKERKNGYSLAFSYEDIVMQFCFTFSNNLHLEFMSKANYLSLISYFGSIGEEFLKPFMDYYIKHNQIDDSLELEALIKEKKFSV